MIHFLGQLATACEKCEAYKSYTNAETNVSLVPFKNVGKSSSQAKKAVKRNFNTTFDERDRIRSLDQFLSVCKSVDKVSFYGISKPVREPKSAGFLLSMQFRLVADFINSGLFIYRKK